MLKVLSNCCLFRNSAKTLSMFCIPWKKYCNHCLKFLKYRRIFIVLVAQWIARWISNPKVPGSNPGWDNTFYWTKFSQERASPKVEYSQASRLFFCQENQRPRRLKSLLRSRKVFLSICKGTIHRRLYHWAAVVTRSYVVHLHRKKLTAPLLPVYFLTFHCSEMILQKYGQRRKFL